jgi:hypothetical protein
VFISEPIPAFADGIILNFYTTGFCPKDYPNGSDKKLLIQPFPAFLPTSITCQSMLLFKSKADSSSYPSTPSPFSPRSPTSIHYSSYSPTSHSHGSADASINNGTDTSTDSEFANALSKTNGCFEDGFKTPVLDNYVKEILYHVVEQFRFEGKHGCNTYINSFTSAAAAVPWFFKASFN